MVLPLFLAQAYTREMAGTFAFSVERLAAALSPCTAHGAVMMEDAATIVLSETSR